MAATSSRALARYYIQGFLQSVLALCPQVVHAKYHDKEYAARALKGNAMLPAQKDLFLDEIRKLRKLRSASLVAYIGVSMSKDGMFIITELMAGSSPPTVCLVGLSGLTGGIRPQIFHSQ